MARVSDLSLAAWLEQVADGLDSGLTASNAVTLAKALPGDASARLAERLTKGASWGEALSKASLSLSAAERAVLDASERSGTLPSAMRRIAAVRRDAAKMKKRLALGLAYPIFLLHFAALVFSVSYLVNGDFKAFLVSMGMALVPVWLVFFFFLAMAKLWPRAIRAISRLFPLFSQYRKNWDTGLFCEVLGSCLEAGMEVGQSWEVAIAAADNPQVTRWGEAALASIRDGGKASAGMARSGSRAPQALLQLYRSGEETGSLPQNLRAAGQRYFSDAKERLALAALLYPKLILVAIFGYIAYRVVVFAQEYFQRLMDITA